MKGKHMTLQDAHIIATGAGFKVWHSEDPETLGWWITSPKRYRRASEDHGTFKTEDRAWFAAASMAQQLE